MCLASPLCHKSYLRRRSAERVGDLAADPRARLNWEVLQQIRGELRTEHGSQQAVSAEDVARCWLYVVDVARSGLYPDPCSLLNQGVIMASVSESFEELDFKNTGYVDIDKWGHHMLLTSCGPLATSALRQLEMLLDTALLVCPGILVGLQHALEVAALAGSDGEEGEPCQGHLPWREVLGIYSRKLWHLRTGSSAVVLRHGFCHETVEGFVRDTLDALEVDGGDRVSPSDFLALCVGRSEWPVTLHVYDLSKGAAAVLAPWLLGQPLEGLWHTGIVVFSKEYFFAGEMYMQNPGKTVFGTPSMAVDMGSTLRQADELHAWVHRDMKPLFTRDRYDLMCNNCNHFSDAMAMFLVGKHVPEDILKQPDVVMQTILGRILRPVLTRAQRQHFMLNGGEEKGLLCRCSTGAADKNAQCVVTPAEEELWGKDVAL